MEQKMISIIVGNIYGSDRYQDILENNPKLKELLTEGWTIQQFSVLPQTTHLKNGSSEELSKIRVVLLLKKRD